MAQRLIKYKMPKAYMDMLLKARKGNEKKMSNQKYLCKYVQDTCGLLGTVIKVIGE